jgi:hypothetical protein
MLLQARSPLLVEVGYDAVSAGKAPVQTGLSR